MPDANIRKYSIKEWCMSSGIYTATVLSLLVGKTVRATEEAIVFRPIIRLFFLGRAGIDVARERIEEALDVFTIKAGEYKTGGGDCVANSCNRFKQAAKEVAAEVWERSEFLEGRAKEKLRRQVAEFSAAALSDSIEINELRAEIAQLRAEVAQLKAAKAAV
jgi:hypothetical protein